MSYTLEFPIQYFPNPDRFATLGLGELYIGVVDGDPAFEPADRVQAYIARQNDTDLAIPQPINLTAGGVPTYNGSPVTLKIGQEYSLAVLDKNGQQVYYSPKAGEMIEEINELSAEIAGIVSGSVLAIDKVSDLITYAPISGNNYFLRQYNAGTAIGGGMLLAKTGVITPNDVTTFASGTAGVYFERVNYMYISPEMAGVIGDGIINDTIALQRAINVSASLRTKLISYALTMIVSPSGITIPENLQWYGNSTTTVSSTAAPSTDWFFAHNERNITIHGVNFDTGDFTVAATYAQIAFLLCDNVTIKKCSFVKFDRMALGVNACSNIYILRNIYRRTTIAASYNQSINVSQASGASANINIDHNLLVNSALNVSCSVSSITNNRIQGFGFGFGIVTEQDPLCNSLNITGNRITGGVGTDVNATIPGGIENWAPFSTLANNIIQSNAGAGIDNGGKNCTVSGNICQNNGILANGSGITARWGDATYNASGSVFTGNRSYNTAGAAGTQSYGYEEQNSSLVNIVLSGNQFQGNRLRAVNILSNATSYTGLTISAQVTYDPPSIAAGAQTATDVVCVGAAVGDFVQVGFFQDLQLMQIWGYVNAPNNVKVVMRNGTAAAIDLASGTLFVKCEKNRLSADI